MIATSDFRKGAKILYKEQPYSIIDYQHVKPGKGGAFVRTRMKNMITGLVHEDTFRSGEKFDAPNLEYRDMVYLYQEDGIYQFMDQDNYEQVGFNKDQLDQALDYLKEQEVYKIINFEDKPIAVTPPLFMVLTVTETPPGCKGDTAQGAGTKPATLETGLVVQVPLFVHEGDKVKVDTRDGNYIERVQK
ncbi:MAG: elongation factor P [Candidatus Babeliales bacterium]|nr:elongation factor P [Candidatus Babeliales bacterium]